MIAFTFNLQEQVVLYHGSCLDSLSEIADRSIQLIVTSPPYNIGKKYEKILKIEDYIKQQAQVDEECVRVLSDSGSICWQVGNDVNRGATIPFDTIPYPIFNSLNLV